MDSRETRLIQMISLINQFNKRPRMNDSKVTTKDPICGMTVDVATAIHAESEGKMFFFCSDHCLQKFLLTPAGINPVSKPGNCCG